MNLVNTTVKHKAFGVGTVVSQDGKYITVQFEGASKVFVYPDIFEKFLTLEDGSVSAEIIADLNEVNARKQSIQDKKNEENMRAMTKGIVIPGKEIVPGEGDEDESRKNETEEI